MQCGRFRAGKPGYRGPWSRLIEMAKNSNGGKLTARTAANLATQQATNHGAAATTQQIASTAIGLNLDGADGHDGAIADALPRLRLVTTVDIA
jgi:hypothetical protein